MKTNSFNTDRNRQSKRSIIFSHLPTKSINKIARHCGFLKRRSGKITPENLLIGFMLMASRGRNTYAGWAEEIGLLEKKRVAKQSVCERMNPQTECFIKKVVEQQLLKKIPCPTKKVSGILKHFGHVLIEDSTTLSLPDELAGEFPGNVVAGKRRSQAKIHAAYNLTENNFSFLHLHSYADNDQKLAADALPFLKKGDLCIRDLGFLVLPVVKEFIKEGIYFISRKTFHTKIYDTRTGKMIDLVKVLRKKKFFDCEVLIGMQHQVKVRLIAMPVSDTQAAQRKRKARSDRSQSVNHSAEYYELLGYSLYITNILPEQCTAENIFQIYKLRWNIEIIFKSWKSCFCFNNLIHRTCKNAIRVKCILYLMLLYIYLFHILWRKCCELEFGNRHSLQLSILKMSRFFFIHFEQLLIQKSEKHLLQQIKLHCAYEKRNDRDNAILFQLKLAA
jgi:hypothetical protein